MVKFPLRRAFMEADTVLQTWPLPSSEHLPRRTGPFHPHGAALAGRWRMKRRGTGIGGGAALAPVLLALARLPAFPRRGQVTKTFTKTCPLAPPIGGSGAGPGLAPHQHPLRPAGLSSRHPGSPPAGATRVYRNEPIGKLLQP